MASFIPTTDVESIGNYGEKLVAGTLKKAFDKRTVVYHSYPWLRRSVSRTRTPLQPGDIVFVVVQEPRYSRSAAASISFR